MRALTLALVAILAGCSSGAVKGNVIVGAGTPSKLGIFVALWSVDSQPSDAKDPHSTLIPKPNGAAPTFMGTAVAGTSTGKPGTYQYAFHTLDRGLYYVGAYLADPSDPAPDLYTLIHTIDSASLLEVDPDVKKKQEVSHDVYLGISGPGLGTIRGTVRASARAAASPISVLVGDGSVLSSSTTFFDQYKLPAGEDVPFAFFNVPPGKTYLFADANVGSDSSINNDYLGFPSPNPIELDGTHTEQDNVDIWVDRQSPDLGSISGTLLLNAPVSNALVQLVLESGSYGSGDAAAIVNIPVNGSSATFTIPSVPFGSFFLSSYVQVELGGTQQTGSSYYPGPPNVPAAIAVSTGSPNVSELKMPIGVGQILGHVNLTNIPATYKAAWVLVSVDLPNPSPGMNAPQLIMAGSGFAIDTTSLSTTYQLFGFTDATYNVFLVPAPTTDADPISLINAGASTYSGNPATVTVEGGDRVNSQFDLNFSH